jgi:FkbM family methyltransferase
MTPESYELVQCSGFVMATDPNDTNIRNRLKDFGVWEPHATKVVLEKFRGGTFVDVGAHWGYYSMLLAQQVDRVFALEPNPITFQYLVENVRLNGFTNVIPIQIAGWDKKARLMAGPPSKSNTGGTKVDNDTNGNVWGEALDTLFRPNEVQFLKIDCEGADSKVLDGAKRILTEGSPMILIESPPTTISGYNCVWYSNNEGQGATHLWVKK